jgi:uncharacterized membrane protein YphA (DoxX/SURF4 family)
VLRLALTYRLCTEGANHVAAGLEPTTVAVGAGLTLFGVALIACGVFIAVGSFVAWVASLVTALVGLAVVSRFLSLDLAILSGQSQEFMLELALAIGLALTGGGDYSVDAWLFGRRTISIPPRVNSAH